MKAVSIGSARYVVNKQLLPMNDVQFAYLAGIIDGEGCITITKQTNAKAGKRGFCYRPVVHVANTHSQVLITLQEMTGLGQARKFDDARPNRKERWQWMIWSQQAAQIVRGVLPHLIIKRRQAMVFLAFVDYSKSCRSPGTKGLSDEQIQRQHEYYTQIRTLNA